MEQHYLWMLFCFIIVCTKSRNNKQKKRNRNDEMHLKNHFKIITKHRLPAWWKSFNFLLYIAWLLSMNSSSIVWQDKHCIHRRQLNHIWLKDSARVSSSCSIPMKGMYSGSVSKWLWSSEKVGLSAAWYCQHRCMSSYTFSGHFEGFFSRPLCSTIEIT